MQKRQLAAPFQSEHIAARSLSWFERCKTGSTVPSVVVSRQAAPRPYCEVSQVMVTGRMRSNYVRVGALAL